MSNFPLISASRLEYLPTSETGAGICTDIPGAEANTKGTTTIIGTTSFAYDGFVLNVSNGTGNKPVFRIDVLVNGQIVVSDLWWETMVTSGCLQSFDLPIAVPAGATVAVRVQSNLAFEGVRIGVTGYALDFTGGRRFSRAVCLNGITNTVSSATASMPTGTSAWTGYTEVVAATAERIGLLAAGVGDGTGHNYATDLSACIVDWAIGAAGSEQRLAKCLWHVGYSGARFGLSYIPCDIPAGSRLSARVKPNQNPSLAYTATLNLMGFIG